MKGKILSFVVSASICSVFLWNCVFGWIIAGLPYDGVMLFIPIFIGILLYFLTTGMIFYSKDAKSEIKENKTDELLDQMDRMLGAHFNGDISNSELYRRFFDLKKDYTEGKKGE